MHPRIDFGTIDLFGDFQMEFRDRETGSFYTQQLGEVSRHKGQWIGRTLSRLSEILGSLLPLGWSCHWESIYFHLLSPRADAESIRKFWQVAGREGEWFSINYDQDGVPQPPEPRPYDWGGDWVAGNSEPGKRCGTDFNPQSIVRLRVLDEFQNEMDYSGVELYGVPYYGPRPPRAEWPKDNNFKLADHVSNLGKSIHNRLTQFSILFDAIDRETKSWHWFPRGRDMVYGSPLTRDEVRMWLNNLNVPMDRVQVMTVDEALRQFESVSFHKFWE